MSLSNFQPMSKCRDCSPTFACVFDCCRAMVGGQTRVAVTAPTEARSGGCRRPLEGAPVEQDDSAHGARAGRLGDGRAFARRTAPAMSGHGEPLRPYCRSAAGLTGRSTPMAATRVCRHTDGISQPAGGATPHAHTHISHYTPSHNTDRRHRSASGRRHTATQRWMWSVLVNALVLSQVRYCIAIYGNGSKKNLSQIQKMINYGAKVIFDRKKYDHVSDLLHRLRWLSTENMALYHTLCAVHKVVRHREPEQLAAGFVTVAEMRECRECRAGPRARTATFTCPDRALRWGRGALAVAVQCFITNCHLICQGYLHRCSLAA